MSLETFSIAPSFTIRWTDLLNLAFAQLVRFLETRPMLDAAPSQIRSANNDIVI